jgi:hypothetical protein
MTNDWSQLVRKPATSMLYPSAKCESVNRAVTSTQAHKECIGNEASVPCLVLHFLDACGSKLVGSSWTKAVSWRHAVVL